MYRSGTRFSSGLRKHGIIFDTKITEFQLSKTVKVKNSFRIISAILILIAFSCNCVVGFAQSNSVVFQNAYSLQKGNHDKHTSIYVAVTSNDILIENETEEDNEESFSDSDFNTEKPEFKISNTSTKATFDANCKHTVSRMILYCVFRI